MTPEEIEKELQTAISPMELVEQASKLVRQEGIKYSEAILDICKDRNLEPEDITKIIPAPLKEKLKNEAMDYHMLKDTRVNKLDFK